MYENTITVITGIHIHNSNNEWNTWSTLCSSKAVKFEGAIIRKAVKEEFCRRRREDAESRKTGRKRRKTE